MKIRILLCLLFILSGCTVQELGESEIITPVRPDNGNGEESGINDTDIMDIVEVSVFGIGRADAVLITTENHVVMIDTGERQHGQLIVNYLSNKGIRQIDYLIVTHFDRDHVGGAYIIINDLDVKKVIVPNYSRDSNHVSRFATAMRNNGLEAVVLTETMRLALDGAEFMIDPSQLEYMHFVRDDDIDFEHFFFDGDDEDYEYDYYEYEAAAEEAAEPTTDDFSIVVSVTHGENSLLFTGDAWTIRLQELLENEEIMNTRYDFLKMPRHGRYNARIIEFIHAMNPRYAVITGFHPDDLVHHYPERPADGRVVAALEYMGAEIYFAMRIGVHAKSDGAELIVGYRDFFSF